MMENTKVDTEEIINDEEVKHDKKKKDKNHEKIKELGNWKKYINRWIKRKCFKRKSWTYQF